MTNDIKDIRNKYLSSDEKEISLHDTITYEGKIPTDNDKFKENDLVVLISTGKQMRIKRITEDGKYSCYTNSGMNHEGDFSETELRKF